MQLVTKRKPAVQMSAEERQVRIDLAAAHRLAVLQGFSEGIYNHFTNIVPGSPKRFLAIPFGLHWSEATASGLLSVGYDGKVVSGDGEVERSAYCIHAPLHRLLPRATCVLHTHMPFASALTRLEAQQVLAIGQTEVSLMGAIAYDEIYTGFARHPSEGERLAAVMGPDKTILFMANHGVIVIGNSIAEAYDRLFYLERACQVQLYAMWTGNKLRYVDPKIVRHTSEQFAGIPSYYGRPNYDLHFDALKRLLDRKEPKKYFE